MAVGVGPCAIDAAQRGALALASYSGFALRNAASFAFDLILALFASFLLLRDSRSLAATVRRVMPLEGAARDRLIGQTADLIGVSVRSESGAIGLVPGPVVMATAAVIVGAYADSPDPPVSVDR